MEIQYHGHSCIQISVGGKSLIIDPFVSGNSLARTKVEDIHTNVVLLTHAHTDHILDADVIAKQNNISIVSNPELAAYMSWKGADTIDMNIGGTVDLGFAKAKMIQAFHSSGIVNNEGRQILYGGMSAGYIVSAADKHILHTGDTALFSDMRMIGERHALDVAIIPIGDHYTMGMEDAWQAAQWLNAKLTIPVHYNTFPVIEQDAEAFVAGLEARGLKGKVLKPGEKMVIS